MSNYSNIIIFTKITLQVIISYPILKRIIHRKYFFYKIERRNM